VIAGVKAPSCDSGCGLNLCFERCISPDGSWRGSLGIVFFFSLMTDDWIDLSHDTMG
jgi:hypothetical protein